VKRKFTLKNIKQQKQLQNVGGGDVVSQLGRGGYLAGGGGKNITVQRQRHTQPECSKLLTASEMLPAAASFCFSAPLIVTPQLTSYSPQHLILCSCCMLLRDATEPYKRH